MDSLRSLGVKGSYDEAAGAVRFYLPPDLPFSAASLQGTLSALQPLANDSEVSAEFNPDIKAGMVISAAVANDVEAGIEQMFTQAVPLKAVPTEADLGIDLLCVDVDDCAAMVDPAQVLTVRQLKQFLRRLPSVEEYCSLRGSELVNMWRLKLRDEGYFTLGTTRSGQFFLHQPVLGSRALANVLRPKYGARGIDLVELIQTSIDGTTPALTVRIHIQGEVFDTVFHEMVDRLRDNLPTGFSHATLGPAGFYIQMTYTGDACVIEHPQKLGKTMHELLRPAFRVISAFPTGGSSIKVYYTNPEDFASSVLMQTSATYYIPVVSDR